jgi:hypothetical protein
MCFRGIDPWESPTFEDQMEEMQPEKQTKKGHDLGDWRKVRRMKVSQKSMTGKVRTRKENITSQQKMFHGI